MNRHRFDASTALAALIVFLIFAAIVGGAFGIRLAITGGDVGCVFAQDPALCAAVKSTSTASTLALADGSNW